MSTLLPPKVRIQLLSGLKSAFTDIGKFDAFLRTYLSKERSDFAADNKPYPEQIELVVTDSEKNDWVESLVSEAQKAQPTNKHLKSAVALYAKYQRKGQFSRTPDICSSWIRSRFGIHIPSGFLASLVLLMLILGCSGVIQLSGLRVFERHKNIIKPFETSINVQAGSTRDQDIMPFDSSINLDEVEIGITKTPDSVESWWMYDEDQLRLSLRPMKKHVGIHHFEFTAEGDGFTDHREMQVAIPPYSFENFRSVRRNSDNETSFRKLVSDGRFDVKWNSENLEIQEFRDDDKTYVVGKGTPKLIIYAGEHYRKRVHNSEHREIRTLAGKLRVKDQEYFVDASQDGSVEVDSSIALKSIFEFYRKKKKVEKAEEVKDYLGGVKVEHKNWKTNLEIHKGVSMDGTYLQLKERSGSTSGILQDELFTIDPPTYENLKGRNDIVGTLEFNESTNRITIHLKKMAAE